MNTLRHRDANVLSLNGAPTSAAKRLISATMAAVFAVSFCWSAGPASFKCCSTAFAAARASGCRTNVPAKYVTPTVGIDASP